jgi:NAD(P)-dependent dehydrogenase (short-subunit alcohol dehydrogenase family)
MRCKGKVSIVTGGGRGIGEAIALALACEGSDVAILDLDGDQAGKVAKRIQDMDRRSLAIHMDVAKSQEVNLAVQKVLEELGKIDILVNNAGICQIASIEEIQEEDWDRIFAVNLKGVFLCSQAVMRIMKRQKLGKIINLASVSGKVGGIVAGAHYAASKAAVICFTKSLARELAPHGITVNAIAPGVIETEMTTMLARGDWSGFLKSIPLGRIGSVNEVAKVAVFLASADASYVTGEIIDVNGGQLMD